MQKVKLEKRNSTFMVAYLEALRYKISQRIDALNCGAKEDS